jgi:hypothetical protein
MDSKDNTLGKLAIPFNKGTELLINSLRSWYRVGS